MPKDFSRTERVADQIQRIVATLIQHDVKDPRMPSFVTISTVKVTSDFSYAKIYITVLGDDKQRDVALDILRHAAGYLRKELGRRVKLRKTPELQFVYDTSIEYADRLSNLINEVAPKDDTSE